MEVEKNQLVQLELEDKRLNLFCKTRQFLFYCQRVTILKVVQHSVRNKIYKFLISTQEGETLKKEPGNYK